VIGDLSKKLDQAIAEHVKFMRTLGEGFAKDAGRIREAIELIEPFPTGAKPGLEELAAEFEAAARYLADVTSEAEQ